METVANKAKDRVIVHFTGCGFYYATEKGQQLSKHYKTLGNLRKYGKIA